MVDCSKHCFEVADRDCEARPLPNQLCGGTKKVLWTFFARALKSKSEVEIKLFELLISVSRHSGWLTALEPFGSSSSLINCVGAGLRNQTLRVTDFCLSTQWLIDGTRTFRFFVQSNQLCGGRTTKSNSSSYWFLSLDTVVDWRYSNLSVLRPV